jgi:hypothetical protein
MGRHRVWGTYHERSSDASRIRAVWVSVSVSVLVSGLVCVSVSVFVSVLVSVESHMSTCNREACALRLERLAASATILAKDLRTGTWHQAAVGQATVIKDDAQYVHAAISGDGTWAAGDR